MTLGQQIKSQRKVLKETQKELAAKAGISNSYLSDIESNRTNPSLKTLIKISKALNIDLSLLVNSNESIALSQKQNLNISKHKDRLDFLHSLFNSVEEGMVITNDIGKIVDCNNNLCQILGLSRAKLVGIKATNLIHPNNLWKIRDLHTSENKKIYILEELMNQKNRTITKYVVNIQKITYRNNYYFLGIFNTTSHEKKAYNLLNTHPSTWYRYLLDHSPNAVLLLDIKMTILEVNASATEFFEQLRVNLVGKDFRDICNFENIDPSQVDFFHSFKKGQCMSTVINKQINSNCFKKASVTMYPIQTDGIHSGYCLSYSLIQD